MLLEVYLTVKFAILLDLLSCAQANSDHDLIGFVELRTS